MRLLIGLLILALYLMSAALEQVDIELGHQQTIHITHSHPAPDHDDNVPHSHCVSVGSCAHCLTFPSITLSFENVLPNSEPVIALKRLPEDPDLASIFRPPIA